MSVKTGLLSAALALLLVGCAQAQECREDDLAVLWDKANAMGYLRVNPTIFGEGISVSLSRKIGNNRYSITAEGETLQEALQHLLDSVSHLESKP